MLPVLTAIDIQKALEDQIVTAQEGEQIIASVWQGVVTAVALAAAMIIFNRALSKEP